MISPTFTSSNAIASARRSPTQHHPINQTSSFFSPARMTKQTETTFRRQRATSRDDFVFYKRFARALGYARTPITWTCSTSAGSCPSSRATCARPPRPCGAPCLAARAKRKAVWVSGVSEKRNRMLGASARMGATGETAHRAYLLQRVIRGVEVFDILFARVRFRNAIAGGQRERSRGRTRGAFAAK